MLRLARAPLCLVLLDPCALRLLARSLCLCSVHAGGGRVSLCRLSVAITARDEGVPALGFSSAPLLPLLFSSLNFTTHTHTHTHTHTLFSV